MARRYKVLRVDRSTLPVVVGEWLYPGFDFMCVAQDDTRLTGIAHVAVSCEMRGVPFFTIPRGDVEEIDDAQQ